MRKTIKDLIKDIITEISIVKVKEHRTDMAKMDELIKASHDNINNDELLAEIESLIIEKLSF